MSVVMLIISQVTTVILCSLLEKWFSFSLPVISIICLLLSMIEVVLIVKWADKKYTYILRRDFPEVL